MNESEKGKEEGGEFHSFIPAGNENYELTEKVVSVGRKEKQFFGRQEGIPQKVHHFDAVTHLERIFF